MVLMYRITQDNEAKTLGSLCFGPVGRLGSFSVFLAKGLLVTSCQSYRNLQCTII